MDFKDWMSKTIDLSSVTGESKRVNIDRFLDKYIKGAVIDESLLMCLTDKILKGYDYAVIDNAVIKELNSKLAAHKKTESLLFKTAQLNNMGMTMEKNGKIVDAIEVYEKNIELGYRALHAYDRLRILYHKAKDYKNEIRVINRMIEVYEIDPSDESNWWVMQLHKAEVLLNRIVSAKSANATA